MSFDNSDPLQSLSVQVDYWVEKVGHLPEEARQSVEPKLAEVQAAVSAAKSANRAHQNGQRKEVEHLLDMLVVRIVSLSSDFFM